MRDGLRVLAVVPARGAGPTACPTSTSSASATGRCWPTPSRRPRGARSRRPRGRLHRRRRAWPTWRAPPAPRCRSCGPRELAGDIPSLKPVIVHAVREMEAAGRALRRGGGAAGHHALPRGRGRSTQARRAAAGGRLRRGGLGDRGPHAQLARAGRRACVPLFEKEGRRDEQRPVYKENGAVVALRRAVLDGPTRFGERVGFLVLDKRAGFTVHDLEDFWMAERLLRQPRILFRVDGGAAAGHGPRVPLAGHRGRPARDARGPRWRS